MARAEVLGYEGIFFSEHHFGPAYSPAPNLLIAQVALKTRTIRLGVMGLVLPYHQPWKIVEEIGYFPSTQARALVSGRSRTFGLARRLAT